MIEVFADTLRFLFRWIRFKHYRVVGRELHDREITILSAGIISAVVKIIRELVTSLPAR